MTDVVAFRSRKSRLTPEKVSQRHPTVRIVQRLCQRDRVIFFELNAYAGDGALSITARAARGRQALRVRRKEAPACKLHADVFGNCSLFPKMDPNLRSVTDEIA